MRSSRSKIFYGQPIIDINVTNRKKNICQSLTSVIRGRRMSYLYRMYSSFFTDIRDFTQLNKTIIEQMQTFQSEFERWYFSYRDSLLDCSLIFSCVNFNKIFLFRQTFQSNIFFFIRSKFLPMNWASYCFLFHVSFNHPLTIKTWRHCSIFPSLDLNSHLFSIH